MKRLLSLVLAVVLCIGALSMTVFANPPVLTLDFNTSGVAAWSGASYTFSDRTGSNWDSATFNVNYPGTGGEPGITGFTVSGDANFDAVTTVPATFTAATTPGTVGTITITPKSTVIPSTTPVSGTITIDYNNGTAQQITLSVSAQGTANISNSLLSGSLTFNSTVGGSASSSSGTIQITNSGTVDLTGISIFSLHADESNISVSPNSIATLAPGATANVTITQASVPASSGNRTISYTISATGTGGGTASSSFNVDLNVTAATTYSAIVQSNNTALGSKNAQISGTNTLGNITGGTVVFQNNGTGTLTNVRLTGASTYFTVSPPNYTSVISGGTVQFTLTPKSTLPGDGVNKTETFTLAANETFTSAAPTVAPSITVTPYIPNHTFTVSPATELDFGTTTNSGALGVKSFTVTNTGDAGNFTISLSATAQLYYEISGSSTISLSNGQTGSFNIKPKSLGVGTYNETNAVTITKTAGGTPVNRNLKMTVSPVRGLSVTSGSNLTFSTAAGSSPSAQNFTVRNTGTTTENNVRLAYVSGDASLFNAVTPTNITNGQSHTFMLDPNSAYVNGLTNGNYTVTYRVISDDITNGPTITARMNVVSPVDGQITAPLSVYDSNGDLLEDIHGAVFYDDFQTGKVTLDGVAPGQTFYIRLNTQDTLIGTEYITSKQLVDTDLFKISTKKSGDGKSLVKSIEQVERNIGGTRYPCLKVVLNDSTTTKELKAEIDITLKARKAIGTVKSGDKAIMTLNLWINNKKVDGSDGSGDVGDGMTFNPEKNEKNTLIWGDDRAALKFTADDDAKDFYAKLSTKALDDIYRYYGDPANADLWFYNFVGNPTVPATSRATLTLGIPWDDDDDRPNRVWIYQLIDGDLYDVSNQFSYSYDDYDIEGWSTRTRVLGTYIVSDKELDLDDPDPVEPSTPIVEQPGGGAAGKPVANTGR